MFVTVGRYLGVQKAKNGDRGTIVFTAAVSTGKIETPTSECRSRMILYGVGA